MIQKIAVVGPLQCNCILLACEKTKEAVLIDPGDEAQKIVRMVEPLGVKVKYLLHTHAHFDHIGATSQLKQIWGAPPVLHAADDLIYRNLVMQGQMFGMSFQPAPDVEKFIVDEELLTFGEETLKVIHTPGHSPGSVCFQLVQKDERVFSGDTLFRESIGRADLWGGDPQQLIQSIQEKLMILDDRIEVFPGHGPKTSIGHERQYNPFLR